MYNKIIYPKLLLSWVGARGMIDDLNAKCLKELNHN